jgi:hypothetical protein
MCLIASTTECIPISACIYTGWALYSELILGGGVCPDACVSLRFWWAFQIPEFQRLFPTVSGRWAIVLSVSLHATSHSQIGRLACTEAIYSCTFFLGWVRIACPPVWATFLSFHFWFLLGIYPWGYGSGNNNLLVKSFWYLCGKTYRLTCSSIFWYLAPSVTVTAAWRTFRLTTRQIVLILAFRLLSLLRGEFTVYPLLVNLFYCSSY